MNQPDGTADSAIDAAVMHWRAGVRGLEGRELDELTDHVASSARTLMEGNLAPDEAVLIAARRLGAERELVREFERGDGRSRGLDPRGLLLLGAALALVARPLLSVPATATSMALETGQLRLSGSFWIPTLVTALATAIALMLLVRLRSTRTLLDRVRRRPGRASVLFVAALLVPTALALFDHWVVQHNVVGRPVYYGGVAWSSTIAGQLVYVVLPLALFALAHRRLRQPLPE